MTKALTVLTAYDFNTARALEAAGVDMILVGDSLAMVALGYENTTLVSVDEMLMCTAAVARGVNSRSLRAEGEAIHKPLIIADLPYAAIMDRHAATRLAMTETINHCQRFIAAGADIIKIENARPQSLELIRRLRTLGIRVMGHIGYTPQDIELFAKSKIIRDADALMRDAKALVEAGVESMVLEMVPYEIARDITAALNVSTVGIGSGPYTTGQVLVTDDMLGRYNLINPKFLRRYAQQYDETVQAVKTYINDVQGGDFPTLGESYS